MPGPGPGPKIAPDLEKALASKNFATKIHALREADSKELLYMKLNGFLQKTTRMLGLESDQVAVGYANKAEDAVDVINKPLVGSIFQGIGTQDVQDYVSTLFALPQVKKDKDYMAMARSLIRASKTKGRIRDEYPGYEEAWNEFFDEDLRDVFEKTPNVIADPDRKQLFEALAGIVSGDVPYGLEDYEDAIKASHEAFESGDTETLSDGLFGITAALTRTPPPKPPGTGGDDEDEDDESEGGKGPGVGGGGGKSKKPKKNEEGEEDDDAEEDADEDEDEGEEDEEESEDEEGEEEEEDEDPFSKLGSYMDSLDEDGPEPEPLEIESEFDNPKTPDDVDMGQMQALAEVGADVGLPTVNDGTAYVYFETPAPEGARQVWGSVMGAYRSELRQMMSVIEEFYRTSTFTDRGLYSGRPDANRLYRTATNQRDVFRRDFIGSIGNMDLRIILDESGSMDATDQTEGFRDVKLPRGLHYGHAEELYFGRAHAHLTKDRASVARIMAMLLMECSRRLEGFHVKVSGYHETDSYSLGPLQSVGEAVAKIMQDKGRNPYGIPVVRQLASRKNPYPLATTSGIGGNADAEGLAWAVEDLKDSMYEQKAIIYLADGHVFDGEDIIEDLLKKAKRMGIYVYFMNLSGSEYTHGGLAQIDNHLVSSMKDVMDGLKEFLNTVVRHYA